MGALADEQARLVGEAQAGSGRIACVATDHEQPGREVVDQPDLLALVDRAWQDLGRLVQGAERVDRA
jgi:hypothetical protein